MSPPATKCRDLSPIRGLTRRIREASRSPVGSEKPSYYSELLGLQNFTPDSRDVASNSHFPRVVLRITVESRAPATVIRVDGHLAGDLVAELERACGAASGRVALDLSELQSADSRGVEVIRRLLDDGAELEACSPFIELLLKAKGSSGANREESNEP